MLTELCDCIKLTKCVFQRVTNRNLLQAMEGFKINSVESS